MANWFSNLPGRIGGFFSNAGSLLVNAGASIINGFWDGLKSAWNNVTGWIGGIGDWIKEHKGPPAYDAVLLTRNGQLIMQGFAKGLDQGFNGSVVSTIGRINDRLGGMSLDLASPTGAGGSTTVINVTVEGKVIDKEGTAKAIKRLLADYDARRS